MFFFCFFYYKNILLLQHCFNRDPSCANPRPQVLRCSVIQVGRKHQAALNTLWIASKFLELFSGNFSASWQAFYSSLEYAARPEVTWWTNWTYCQISSNNEDKCQMQMSFIFDLICTPIFCVTASSSICFLIKRNWFTTIDNYTKKLEHDFPKMRCQRPFGTFLKSHLFL